MTNQQVDNYSATNYNKMFIVFAFGFDTSTINHGRWAILLLCCCKFMLASACQKLSIQNGDKVIVKNERVQSLLCRGV